KDAHAENSKAAARVHVDHFTVQLARAPAVADAETQFCTSGNGFQGIDVATTGAQLGKLCKDRRSVAKGNLGIREKREPRIGPPYCVGAFSHVVSLHALTAL